MAIRWATTLAFVLALQIATSAASSDVPSEDVQSRQKRLVYIPLTDIFTYNQIVAIGFSILLLLLLIVLLSASDDAASGYAAPHRRIADRNGMLSEWTDDWYSWVPVLDNLMTAVDKYRDVYHAASDARQH